jgi:hypothetical protein
VENVDNFLKGLRQLHLTPFRLVENLWKKIRLFHRVFILTAVFPEKRSVFHRIIHSFFHRKVEFFHRYWCSLLKLT